MAPIRAAPGLVGAKARSLKVAGVCRSYRQRRTAVSLGPFFFVLRLSGYGPARLSILRQ